MNAISHELLFCSGKKYYFVSQSKIHAKIYRSFALNMGWYWYEKLKLKAQFPANSFGPFAETESYF